ncbi:PucR family transcriptional regulator [Amycolatopsis sp. CA-230715]|uniref:PucR family transcriptional regulator n=1 Tax=Amycolatopsis sp. CA-230715 TaxID=2745196 RepID=UPI001C0101EA|nr:PucR family transcriptional regulator [Amycolatopsis sp. CA-230715]QWF82889.1 hypothetical protein HUW46_06328 [Amycolatopsis sp. CA-230715]
MTAVKTLLDIPELRLRLRTGSAFLDREVTRIYGTELADPGRYLSAGELVLSGLLWWHAPGDAEPFVAALGHAGSAALAASGADSGGIPADLVEACERHRIPLLEVPPDLSFAVVTERVVLALAADRRKLSAAADEPPDALLEIGAEELGMPCWLLSGSGKVLASAGPDLPAPRALVERYAQVRDAFSDGAYTVRPVAGGAALPWLLVAQGETGTVGEELAVLLGAARARADRVNLAAGPLIAVLARATAGEPELASAFGGTDLPADAELRVVIARAPGGLARELLADLVTGSAVLGERDGEAWAIVDTAGAWPSDWVTGAAAAVSTVELLSTGSVRIGLSGAASLAGLRGAAQEARHAVDAARRGHPVVSAEELTVASLLVAGAPDELRAAIRRRVLGPLLAHDAAQRGDLVHTVRTFLRCNGSPAQAAKELHVHVNTLRYRIAKAGELLGTDLTDFASQVEIHLALLAE